MLVNQGLPDNPSHPPSDSAAMPPAAWAKNPRRPTRLTVVIVASDAVPAGDHRAQVVPGTGHENHRDMNEHEAEKRECADEVDRPRGLPPAEEMEKPGEARVEPGRHGETGEDHERAEYRNNHDIGELLQNIVPFCALALGKAQPHMIPN